MSDDFRPCRYFTGTKENYPSRTGWGGGLLEYYTVTELQSLLGDQVSFIVNQHSSELPYPPCDLNF